MMRNRPEGLIRKLEEEEEEEIEGIRWAEQRLAREWERSACRILVGEPKL
jgi:hypothetical protein